MTSLKPQFSISASWSSAGVGTCIVVDLNEMGNQKIAFDMGSTPIFDHAVKASYVFISHGHLDHIGGIFSHARAHSLSFSKAPTYYVPKQLVSKLEKARESMAALDSAMLDHSEIDSKRKESLKSMKIIGVDPGEELIFKPKKCGTMFVRTFAVDHEGHPSIGYLIGRIVPGGLLSEFKDLLPREIGKLVKSGTKVKGNPLEVLEVTYTGDTSASGLINQGINDLQGKKHLLQAFQASLILCELTFLEASDEKSRILAKKSGHLHIDDIPEILLSHGWDLKENGVPSTLVFYHLSHRYRPAYRALNLLASGLPSGLWKSINVVISSFIDSTKENEIFVKECISDNGCVSLLEFVSKRNKSIPSA